MRVSSTSHGILFLRGVGDGRVLARLLALVLIGAVLGVAWADEPYRPEVPILKVAHEGDPVPGILEATFGYLWPPQIDAAGNVLLRAWMYGPGIDESNDTAIWLGQPGALEMVVRDGQQAPDMPEGVVYTDVGYFAVVSETGWIAFTAVIAGPGITEYENDLAVFCGPPGDIRKVLQAGDPVPEVGPEITISAEESLGAGLSDAGTLTVGAGLAGPDLPLWHRAYWIGSRDALELALWEGMPAVGCPECDPDVVMEWVTDISHNDAGQMAFAGGLSGSGIYPINDRGRWFGSPGDWEMLHREGQAMPEFGDLVTIRSISGIQAFNKHGDKVDRIRLLGPVITDENDWVLLAGQPEPMEQVAREGDLTPEAETGFYIASLSGALVNDRHEAFYRGALSDGEPGVYSGFGVYFGPYDDPVLVLESDQAASYFEQGLVFRTVSYALSLAVLNDVGDIVSYTQVGLPEDEEGLTDVLWLRRAITAQWVPIVWSGLEIEGRTVTPDELGNLAYYWWGTGGGDGEPQSFNDLRHMVVKTQFTDGTDGIYRMGPPLLGDTDGDGQVAAAELAAFANCVTGPGGEYTDGCAPLDLDLDGDVDLRDLAPLQAMVGEAR